MRRRSIFVSDIHLRMLSSLIRISIRHLTVACTDLSMSHSFSVPCLSLSVCLLVCLFLWPSLYVCMCLFLRRSLHYYPSACLAFHPSFDPFYPPGLFSVSLPIRLSIHLPLPSVVTPSTYSSPSLSHLVYFSVPASVPPLLSLSAYPAFHLPYINACVCPYVCL